MSDVNEVRMEMTLWQVSKYSNKVDNIVFYLL